MMFKPVVMTLTLIAYALTNSATAAVTYHVGSIQEISHGCDGSAEVEQAADPTQSKYVYEAWIGCGGIGFARSTDGGVRFSAPIAMPLSQSSFSWDPSVAVGPDGTLYVGYMLASNTQMFPVVATSFDHGVTFPQVAQLLPPNRTTGATGSSSRPLPTARCMPRGITARLIPTSSFFVRREVVALIPTAT